MELLDTMGASNTQSSNVSKQGGKRAREGGKGGRDEGMNQLEMATSFSLEQEFDPQPDARSKSDAPLLGLVISVICPAPPAAEETRVQKKEGGREKEKEEKVVVVVVVCMLPPSVCLSSCKAARESSKVALANHLAR